MKRHLFLVAAGIALVLASCGQVPDNFPHILQAKLAEMLDDKAKCPAGTSTDLQE